MTTWRSLRSMTLLLLLSFASLARAQILLKDTAQKGSVEPKEDPTVRRSRNVVVDLALLRSDATTTVSVPLFDGQELRIQREEVRREKAGVIVWKGKIADQPTSHAVFVIKGEALVADVVTADLRVFQIRYVGHRVHSLREIDPTRFRNEAEPLQPVPGAHRGAGALPAADTCSTDPPDSIDALVVYTQAARAAAGGTDAMVATVYLAVEETNQSYLNSDIAQRLRVVHVAEVNYTESGDVYTDLPRLQNGSDGFMDNVPTLRDTYAADVVSLILQTADYCGLGYFMATIGNSFENSAYSVVDFECATGSYSFGHELGHNMGADHDTANAPSPGAFAYDHGFIHPSSTAAESWRTIMSYQTTPASTRVQYWSNPNVGYPVNNVAMGTAASEDNHHVLNDTAATVANFRCSSPGTSNVWMKDTWADTGAEPNPSNDPMWQSPYVWNRNAQDTTLTRQHEHQNPKFGQTNYLYVKLHNGSGSAHTGQLDLRFARAATGLSWPANWTAVSGTPVSVTVAAHSTKVVEIPWSNIPSNPDLDQHYCMVSMWTTDASDPMAVALGTDVNANTKNNNNVIWRNMDVINMTPDAAADASFLLRNVSKRKASLALAIRSPRSERLLPYFQHGRLVVSFDERLVELVRKGYRAQKGVEVEGDNFVITGADGATFGGIEAPAGFEGKVKLTFRLDKDAPKRMYRVSATQTQTMGKRPARVVGGVTYEIYAYPR